MSARPSRWTSRASRRWAGRWDSRRSRRSAARTGRPPSRRRASGLRAGRTERGRAARAGTTPPWSTCHSRSARYRRAGSRSRRPSRSSPSPRWSARARNSGSRESWAGRGLWAPVPASPDLRLRVGGSSPSPTAVMVFAKLSRPIVPWPFRPEAT